MPLPRYMMAELSIISVKLIKNVVGTDGNPTNRHFELILESFCARAVFVIWCFVACIYLSLYLKNKSFYPIIFITWHSKKKHICYDIYTNKQLKRFLCGLNV